MYAYAWCACASGAACSRLVEEGGGCVLHDFLGVEEPRRRGEAWVETLCLCVHTHERARMVEATAEVGMCVGVCVCVCVRGVCVCVCTERTD